MDNLERVHSSIGLLRILFRNVMNEVTRLREEHKKRWTQEPKDLSPFMGHTQELYAELLKASQALSFAEAGESPQRESLDTARKAFLAVRSYFQELPQVNIQGLFLDAGIGVRGIAVVDETLLMIDNHSQDS